jgi:glucose-6-phosphate dehydrogenase assembly protein OpcA
VIIDLTDTTTTDVDKKLGELRESGGAVALGRVLTVVIVTDDDDLELAVSAANEASREHPMRVIVIARSETPEPDDAEAMGRQEHILVAHAPAARRGPGPHPVVELLLDGVVRLRRSDLS